MQVAEAQPTQRREHRVYWWKEALLAAAFYGVYSWTRNQFGSNKIAADGIPDQAFTNAERIIDLELSMGMFHEQTVQAWFLGQRAFIQFWNVFYGTAHFAITLGVFVLLFIRRADVFPQWRNTLAAMTALAILGFAFFPLMPPRLLDAPCPIPVPEEEVQTHYGGACIESSLRGPDGTFGFVDTLADYGGPWSFDSETMASISNQYAAMPSLHIGWATWCAIAVWPLLRNRWAKAVVLLYPALTLFTIVVTGNHYWIDGIGGLIVFGLGALIGIGLHRWNQDRLDRRERVAAAIATGGSEHDDGTASPGPVVHPATDPTDPANDPADDPALDPPIEPVIEPVIERAVEPAAEPAVESGTAGERSRPPPVRHGPGTPAGGPLANGSARSMTGDAREDVG